MEELSCNATPNGISRKLDDNHGKFSRFTGILNSDDVFVSGDVNITSRNQQRNSRVTPPGNYTSQNTTRQTSASSGSISKQDFLFGGNRTAVPDRILNRHGPRPRSEYRHARPGIANMKTRADTATSGTPGYKTTFGYRTHKSPDSVRRAPSTSTLSQGTSSADDIEPRLNRRKGKLIRPLSASCNVNKTTRYTEERLRLMYIKRRATSATSRATCTLQPSSHDNSSYSSEQHCESLSNNLALHTTFSNLRPLAKFRKISYLAIYLRRLMVAMMENCRDNTLRSASELQWLTVYAEKHDVTLVFNKHLYSRDRVSSHVPDWALTILGMSPEKRTEQDCRRLHALLRGMKSFDKFTDEVQMFLCRAFTLERMGESRVVLKSGHTGVNFYFIYSGSVFVNVEDSTRDGRKFMSTVAVLTRGESFGELALLQDIKRTATVTVRERCELLAVDKYVFASVCPRIFDKELAEKYAFLSTLDLFSAKFWSQESIRSLSMNAQIQEYKMNKVIVANSAKEDWIYICMEGRCQIVRSLSLDQTLKVGDSQRKMSEVVLSEEILQLLTSAVDQHGTGDSHSGGNMKENLLTSLGLDYVQTGKKLYLNNDTEKKTVSNVNETMTLTMFVKRYMQNKVKDFVILSLGIIESGQVFDLPSLLDVNSGSKTASTLMLVSGGSRILRVKKVAFFDQVSQQAMDNTRTLASKYRNPSEASILESYKCKVAWDEFKSKLVQGVLRSKELRYQHIYRASVKSADGIMSRLPGQNVNTSQKTNSRIISALRRNHVNENKAAVSSWSVSEESSDGETNDEIGSKNPRVRSPTTILSGNDYFEDFARVNQKEIIILRRHLQSKRTHARVVRNINLSPTSMYRH